MTTETRLLKVGDTIKADLWKEESVRVDDISIMGNYLRLKVTGIQSGDEEDRLLHSRSKSVSVMLSESEWVTAQPPTIDDLRQVQPEIELREGMIVETRRRLWRIDSIDNKSKTMTVVSIDGNPIRHELYWPIEDIIQANFPPPEPDKVGAYRTQKMFLQSMGFSLMYSSTVLTGLQRSSVIPIPFQFVPVIMALNLPKARMLLADDVGLGKTIEAGLIISELAARNLADRILIVTPANLCEQWQDAMNRFFHFNFRIISRRHRRMLERELMVGGNPWLRFPRLIVSIDYIKRDEVLAEALSEQWNVIVVDEAHKIAKPHQSHKGSDPIMQRYQLGKKLAENADNLLLLTATPHNGYRDSFASLLSLLNPDIVKGVAPSPRIDREIARNHVCQRRRRDVEDWFKQSDEKSPFPDADRREVPVQMSSKQETLMQELKALSKHILSASGDEELVRRLAQWTVMHFYKRALSSVYAIECSIKNRLRRLSERTDKTSLLGDTLGLSEDDVKTSIIDDDPREHLTEEEVDKRTARLIFGDPNLVTLESQILQSILETTRSIKPKNDSKLMKLVREILPECLSKGPRVIIFTRFKDTLDYLEREIRKAARDRLTLEGLEVYTIYGELSIPKRKDEFQKFRKSKKGVLVTTDCMSEGIDLQFASNAVIHYELPWNPNRLEQRNGRVDRFGQPADTVYIRTFFTLNSIEAQILEVIIRKAQKIREDYGFAPPFFADDLMVLDALREYGEYVAQTTITDFMEEKESEEFEIETPYTEKRLREIEEDLKAFYGQVNVDLREVHNRMEESMKMIGKPEEIQAFVNAAINLLGGSLQKTDVKEVFECILPDSFEEVADVKTDGKIDVTFDRELGANNPDIHVLDIQSPIVSELISRITERVFLKESADYGRTSAGGCSEADCVAIVYHIRLRFLVRTTPVTIAEQLSRIGLSFLEDVVLDEDTTEKLWFSDPKTHGRVEEEIVQALDNALHHPKLLSTMAKHAEKIRAEMVENRMDLKKRLEKDGLSQGLEGMEQVELSSMDIVGVTVYFPAVSD